MEGRGCFRVLAIFLGIVLGFFLIGLIGWGLWGAICVGVFGLPVLTYWQFLGLFILCNILFKSGIDVSEKLKEGK